MFCGVCGNKLEDGAKFCAMCGSPVPDAAPNVADSQNNNGDMSDSAFSPEESVPAVPTGEEGTTVITSNMVPDSMKDSWNNSSKSESKKSSNQEPQKPANQGLYQPLTSDSANQFNQFQQGAEGDQFQPPMQLPANKVYPQYSGPSGGSGSNLKHTVNYLTIAIISGAAILVILLCVLFFGKILPAMTFDKNSEIAYISDGSVYYLKDMNKPDKAVKVDRVKDYDYLPFYTFSEDGKYLYYYSKYDEDKGLATLSRVPVTKLKPGKNADKYIEDISKDVSSYTLEGNDVYYTDENGRLVQLRKGKETTLIKNIDNFIISEDGKYLYYYTASQSDDGGDVEIGYITVKDGQVHEIDDDINYVRDMSVDGLFVYTKNKEDDTCDLYMTEKSGDIQKIANDISDVIYVDTDKKEVYYEYTEMKEKPMIDYVSYSEADFEAKEPSESDAFKEIKEKKVLKRIFDESLTSSEKKEFYDNLDYDEDTGYYIVYDYDNGGYLYYDKSNKQWYEVDNEKLDQLREEYYSKSGMQDYIDSLKEEKYTVISKTVCVAGMKGDESILCEDVSSVYMYSEMLMLYKKNPTDYEKIDINTAYEEGIYDKIAAIYDKSGETYYRFGKGKEYKFDITADSIYPESSDKDKFVFTVCEDSSEAIYYTEKSGDSLKPLEKITDDYDSLDGTFSDGVYTYIAITGSDGDLYRYNNGNSEKILSDVNNVFIMKTSELLSMDDGDLDIYNKKGDKVDSIRDVTHYVYIDKNQIVYKTDDELYIYSGVGKKLEIADEVTCFSTYAEIYGETKEDRYISGGY